MWLWVCTYMYVTRICMHVCTYIRIMAYIYAGKAVKKLNVGCVLTCRNLKV